MTTELAQKLDGVRDFKKILETVVKELGETYTADVSQIVLSNPLDHNITSICEYKLYPEAVAEEMPVSMSFPLPLEGSGLGAVTLARKNEFHENEVNWIRITLAELSNVIRHSQINDVVQRDTFRNTFLFEIQNVMQYSLGIGDALFMVVNILGKVLNTSRCLFICVDDTHAGWKCYEFWNREKVQSCQEFGWPTTDSPIVARSLMATAPLIVQEANQNSYLSPAQQELQLLGVRSLLGVPLKHESATHGCIILQHCEARHEWTRGEIDMVQNVADTVAEALAKLPDDKRGREPIMRLHQREVIETGSENKESILSVRASLRGALGNTSIPSAQKTSGHPKPKPAAPVTPAAQTAAPAQTQQQTAGHAQTSAADPTSTPNLSPSAGGVQSAPFGADHAQASPGGFEPPYATPQSEAESFGMPTDSDANALGKLADSLVHEASAEGNEDAGTSLQNLLGGMRGSGSAADHTPAPHADQTTSGQQAAAAQGGNWGNLDNIPAQAPTNGGAGDTQWGNLDSIPTPASGSRAGLGGMLGKKSTSKEANASALLASLHKDKSKFQQPSPEFLDGGTLQIDEAQAEEKLKQVLSSSNPTSDYIFATSSLDPRMLGRIDGWVSQVEAKDRYESGHAMQVAEYSLAIAKLLGMPAAQVEMVRLAAIVHDVGKLGLPPHVLQKPEDELEDQELLLKMKHPIDGASLLEGFTELAPLAPVVLAHHEEYNGNGYPAGLEGEDIPLAARIIHVASDYHGMVSATRKRPAMTDAEAQQLLRSGAGKAYDPAIVEALIACVMQGMVAAVT